MGNQYTAMNDTIERLRDQLRQERIDAELTRQERDAYKLDNGVLRHGIRMARESSEELDTLIKAGRAMTDDMHCQRFWTYVLGRITGSTEARGE